MVVNREDCYFFEASEERQRAEDAIVEGYFDDEPYFPRSSQEREWVWFGEEYRKVFLLGE